MHGGRIGADPGRHPGCLSRNPGWESKGSCKPFCLQPTTRPRINHLSSLGVALALAWLPPPRAGLGDFDSM